MADDPHSDVSESARETARLDLEQARAAYSQFADIARRARDMVSASQGAGVSVTTMEIQSRALYFAEQNVNSSFKYAEDLIAATSPDEFLAIQSRYSEAQIKTFAQQAQDLDRLMREASEHDPLQM